MDDNRPFGRDARPEAPHPLGRRPTRAIPKPIAQEPSKKKRAKDPRVSRDPKSAEQKEAAKTARALNGGQIRYLRGLGHHLDPIVQIGKEGITDALVAATKEALLAHELVKVKVLQESPIDRKAAGPELAERAEAALAQTLGRTLLLYRRHPNKPKITLPRR